MEGQMGTKLACMVVLCMVLVGAPLAQAGITCTQVATKMAPCITYLTGSAPLPPTCCTGIKTLNAAASTTPDRRTACQCLKTAASSIPGLNYALAAALPSKCGVNIPYKISPSTDCNTII
ncbi:hypothetical protein ACFE04_002893 [Oxalis oulophora]